MRAPADWQTRIRVRRDGAVDEAGDFLAGSAAEAAHNKAGVHDANGYRVAAQTSDTGVDRFVRRTGPLGLLEAVGIAFGVLEFDWVDGC